METPLANNIQWFPGHIAKAQRQLREKIGLVDCVIELVDARLPVSSHFPFVDEIAQSKPRMIVVTKVDLAPPEALTRAVAYWEAKGYPCMGINVPRKEGLKELKQALDVFYNDLAIKMKKRGRLPRKLRTMVMGLPNVGKSSLINALINKRSTKVGNKPGVTRALQWVRISHNLELLDTPGVIPPSISDQILAIKLALIGSISEYAADPEDIAEASIEVIQTLFPGHMKQMYALEPMTLDDLAERRGFLLPGPSYDRRRAAESFLHDFRAAKHHKMSLEVWAEEEEKGLDDVSANPPE